MNDLAERFGPHPDDVRHLRARQRYVDAVLAKAAGWTAEQRALGRWEEAAVRILPRGQGSWDGIKGRGYTFLIGRRPVATIRKARRGAWRGRIEGFEWLITPDMPQARFQAVPGGASITHTAVKLFPCFGAARREIEAILAVLPPYFERRNA